MTSGTAGGERFDLAYLVLSGTTTAARCPELLQGLVGVGFSTIIAIPTPNASRVIAPRALDEVEGVQVVESYFDSAIRPRPLRGVVLFAPCSFKLAQQARTRHRRQPRALGGGRGDRAGYSGHRCAVAKRAAPCPPAGAGVAPILPQWGVTIVSPVDDGDGPRLAPTAALLDAVRPYVRRG